MKLVVNRGKKGAPTPTFDAIKSQFEAEGVKLIGAVMWDRSPQLTESKVQVSTAMSAKSSGQHGDWVIKNATVLREWAEWSASAKI